MQTLLDKRLARSGLYVAEGYDYEIISRINRPFDDLSILATLKADGNVDKTVIGSIASSFVLDSADKDQFDALKSIFTAPTLQMASFTITEKGYALRDRAGQIASDIAADGKNGPASPISYLGKVTALLYERYRAGSLPIALVSMDNCSGNGDLLKNAVTWFANSWVQNGCVDAGFSAYVNDPACVSFPCSMIDKITPRPNEEVRKMLEADHVQNMAPVETSKHTFAAPFVNAEECEYLVIGDVFPNGRPALEKAGVIFTDRQTVNRVEKMKVGTCLNPLHTTLAVFGCLLGYDKICDEMKDTTLKKLVEIVGYKEGLPVVTDPKIMDPKAFIDTVVRVRIPNPFMPDIPWRIATDTSQKLSVRFGDTIRSYMSAPELAADELRAIPLVLAGWLRYLLGVDDEGKTYEPSPDPQKEKLTKELAPLRFGLDVSDEQIENVLSPLLHDTSLFGVDLYEAGLAKKVLRYFTKMRSKTGAVRETIEEVVSSEQ